MKAYLITPENKLIEPVEVASLQDIKTIIGFDTIESDAVGTAGDRLFFDEECFLRGATGRFQIDKLIPVSGKGIIVSVDSDGTTFVDVVITNDELSQSIKYL